MTRIRLISKIDFSSQEPWVKNLRFQIWNDKNKVNFLNRLLFTEALKDFLNTCFWLNTFQILMLLECCHFRNRDIFSFLIHVTCMDSNSWPPITTSRPGLHTCLSSTVLFRFSSSWYFESGRVVFKDFYMEIFIWLPPFNNRLGCYLR